ncbi:hypothetical protein C8N36_101463 [Pelagimonas varians]|uniref:Uncharacterized protein n=2 Tax=Pelagimonas varians TaxID=696760 RepID=A0A238JR45_9RHOB|nr:hypothetical protein C8N36_101463 [Pelagimonas varians]SMX32342.1 hypothetical protein PEV8663_00004 [Pelagimonas varians]
MGLMRGTLIAICVLATPAVALTPPMPQCARASLAPEEVAYTGYDYSLAGGDFVAYERRLKSGGRWEFIYEHCPSRKRVTVVVTGLDESENRQRMQDAIAPILRAAESKRRYTLHDLRRLARETGAEAEVTTAGYKSCVCAEWGY